ncbi:hypothetical protein [Priestia aryabhattai]|uniref:hypothetical protein n=1 Tax=Priestia aryabhattai TaxID=412384 RepID=UPI002E2019BE|nr:hypothetical protein [Priestia aryabhattai]
MLEFIEEEKVVKTQTPVLSEKAAKEIALHLLQGNYSLREWEMEFGYYPKATITVDVGEEGQPVEYELIITNQR